LSELNKELLTYLFILLSYSVTPHAATKASWHLSDRCPVRDPSGYSRSWRRKGDRWSDL